MKSQKIPTRGQARRLANELGNEFLTSDRSPLDKALIANGWVEPTSTGRAFPLNDGALWPYMRLSEEGWQALRRYFAKTEKMPR